MIQWVSEKVNWQSQATIGLRSGEKQYILFAKTMWTLELFHSVRLLSQERWNRRMLWGIVRAQAGVHCIGGGIAGNSCSLTSTPLVLVPLVHYSHLFTHTSDGLLVAQQPFSSFCFHNFHGNICNIFHFHFIQCFVSVLPEIGIKMYVLKGAMWNTCIIWKL